MLSFTIATAAGLVLTVGAARVLRGRGFAIFAGIILTIQALSAIALLRQFEPVWWLWAWWQTAVFAHFLLLARARMRPWWFRAVVTVPGMFFAGGSILALPWAAVSALGFDPWIPWLPFALAALGVLQSMWTREEETDVALDGLAVDGVKRHPRGVPGESRPLRVVQITDPHLGPFMSVRRLKRICERAVARKPDLILLTGDFLTMESQSDPRLLEEALAPLAAARGKVFACLGNHDHEALEVVERATAASGIRLLVDEEAVVETPVGAVQIVGADFRWRRRGEHIQQVCARYPRREGHLRIVLLHDPGAFRHLPAGHGDIVFSGHTHGGQVGLLSLGLAWTFLSGLTKIPDHGLWARGTDRLYVHRGTGHYGFPLRLGVPAEESLVRLHVKAR